MPGMEDMANIKGVVKVLLDIDNVVSDNTAAQLAGLSHLIRSNSA